jgi:hypothetical protein
MNARQINTMLWATAAALLAGGASAVALMLWLPLERQGASDAGHARSSTKPTTAPASLPPLAAFEKLWSTPLRQPLGAAAPMTQTTQEPIVATPTTADGAPPPVSLVGTIGTSLAMLKTPSNAVEVCGVGESVNGVTVLAVRPAEVDVRYMGRTLKLSKPPEPSPQ